MKMKAAQRVPDPALYGDLNGNFQRRYARKVVICKYWVAGCCKNSQCRFAHGDLPLHNADNGNVMYKSAHKKWCRDFNATQKNANAVDVVSVPLKGKAITPLKSKPIHPVKQRIITLLRKETGTAVDVKKNVSSTFNNKETISSNRKVDIVHEKVDNEKKTPPTNQGEIVTQKLERVCERWVHGNCADAEKCMYLHSWLRGDSFSRVALLEGHEKAISGISLPSGSHKLYSGSSDGTLRCWNCHTGQCDDVIYLEGEIGSLISEGPWLFVGISNSICAKNIETSTEFVLQGLVGQVHSVMVVNDVIFAGTQDGVIVMWKTSSEFNMLQPNATVMGHDKAVVTLAVGGNHLYTGSLDHTIKVWDMSTLQCLQTLNGHTDAVMSLLCLDRFLISCSLDRTIKIWAASEDGKFEVTYTHNEDHGILALAGMNDFESKPILLCACSDKSVRIYELPTFCDRGRLFTRDAVRKIHIGPSGQFFTGDGSGCIAVWRLVDHLKH